MKFAIQDHKRLVMHANPNAQGLTVGVLRGDADHQTLNTAIVDFNRVVNAGPQRQRKATVSLARERFADWLRPQPAVAERPWYTRADSDGSASIFYNADNPPQTPIVIANDLWPDRAAQIVLAVNSHDDLVEVCIAILARLDMEAKARSAAGQPLVFLCAAYRETLRTAIAKAKL